MTDEQQVSRKRLARVAHDLIKETVDLARAAFSSTDLPTYEFETGWFANDADAKQHYEFVKVVRPDSREIYRDIKDQLEGSANPQELISAIKDHERLFDSEPYVMFSDPVAATGQQLIKEYFDANESIGYTPDIAERVITRLIEEVESKTDAWQTLHFVANFSAAGPIDLNGEIFIRPITRNELEDLGAVRRHELQLFQEGWDDPGPRVRVQDSETPDDNLWVMETITVGSKGTPEAANKAHKVLDPILTALRVLKGGELSVVYKEGRPISPYGRDTRSWGGVPTRYSGKDPYSLTPEDIDPLRIVWNQYKTILSADYHYLRVASDRLKFGGERRRLEDSLIDYVMGAESLLATVNEKQEIVYKFSVRSAVVLSGTPSQRPAQFKKMRGLYNLRNKIVHGGRLRPNEQSSLAERVVEAESMLRSLLQWYLDRWSDKENNESAISAIDKTLLIVDQ